MLRRVGLSIWKGGGVDLLTFLLICLGYQLTFSYQFGDALTTAYELQGHFVQGPLSLVEFRHLVNHLWPFWILELLRSWNFNISGIGLLHWCDLACAAASVMLLYRVLLKITEARFISFFATFAYATAHSVWIFTGTGRMYTTSMLFVFAAYYLALETERAVPEQWWLLAASSGVMVCLACSFWLVHTFNVVGIALLLLLLPQQFSLRRRCLALIPYCAAGLLAGLLVAISCLLYVNIPLTHSGLASWLSASGTQPVQFGLHGLMAGAYGQADGLLATPELLYMVHGFMLRDATLAHLQSLPWQLGKFLFVWTLLGLVYVYPWVMLRSASRRKQILILSLYVPLIINMYFALGWLGTDLQRFLPSLLSQVGLGALAVQDLMDRLPRPRVLAAMAISVLVFIAGVNLIESVLPSQIEFTVTAEQMKAIRPYIHWGDLLVTFGRDLDGTYNTMAMFYADANYFTMTNDGYTFDWDRPDWQLAFDQELKQTRSVGGRLFIVDRLAQGFNPPHAAWSERQHPSPTVLQFSQFVHTQYCVSPAFYVGMSQYFQVEPRLGQCQADAPILRPGRDETR